MNNIKNRAALMLPMAAGWLLAASNAHAGIIYSGSISNIGADTSLVGNSAWDSGSSLSWEVSHDASSNEWTYEYTLGVPRKAISHFILGLCPPLDENDFLSISGSNNGAGSIRTFSPSDPGKSNPGLPADIYGLKIDTIGNPEQGLIFSLVTEVAPSWGDFYAKGGKDMGVETYLYNVGFAAENPTDPAANGSLNGHILIPCQMTPVPEPSATIGLALLLAGGCFSRKRR